MSMDRVNLERCRTRCELGFWWYSTYVRTGLIWMENYGVLIFNYFYMAYGFEFSQTGEEYILQETHDWQHKWQKITKLNWVDISKLSWSQVNTLLEWISKRKETVTFLLWNWEEAIFQHNSVWDDIWWGNTIDPQLPEWIPIRQSMIASEDGAQILEWQSRPTIQGLKSAFPH